jgi:hypothetical protein
MHFVLYDESLKAIRNPYKLEKWSRTQRAVDLDSIKIEGAEIDLLDKPFIAVVNDKNGKMLFSGLISTPNISIKTKKTSIILKDYLTLLNSEIIVDQSTFSGTYVSNYISFILDLWKSQADIEFDIDWTFGSLYLVELSHTRNTEDTQNINVCNHILSLLEYYDAYVVYDLDLSKKKLTFKFDVGQDKVLSVKLSDFDIGMIEKSFGECNRATVYDYQYNMKQEWALTADNQVVKLPSIKPLVHPAKNKNFIAKEPNENLNEDSAINDAAYNAVMTLAKNRYQETIDLDANKGEIIFGREPSNYFSYAIDVYTDTGFYKRFPIGEIVTDSNGKYILRLGFRVQELTQEI